MYAQPSSQDATATHAPFQTLLEMCFPGPTGTPDPVKVTHSQPEQDSAPAAWSHFPRSGGPWVVAIWVPGKQSPGRGLGGGFREGGGSWRLACRAGSTEQASRKQEGQSWAAGLQAELCDVVLPD